jgi:hypothetical protein
MDVIEIFSHWDQVREDLLSTMDKFEHDELNYQPYPGC